MFLLSYRNTSGSLGEREMLCREHEPTGTRETGLRRQAYADRLTLIRNFELKLDACMGKARSSRATQA